MFRCEEIKQGINSSKFRTGTSKIFLSIRHQLISTLVVREYEFDVDRPPHYDLILRFVNDITTYLDENPRNIAALQCSTGVVSNLVTHKTSESDPRLMIYRNDVLF